MSTITTPSLPTMASPLKRLIRRHPLIAFFVIAFAGAWIVLLPLVLAQNGLGVLPYTVPTLGPILPYYWFAILGAILGPTLGSLTVTAITKGGWFGFAVPKLQQRFGAWRMTLILGPLWAVFHLTKPRRKSMRKLGIATRVGAALLSLLAVAMAVAGPATGISSVYAQSTSSGPRTWHVLIGGQSESQAIQAEGYYPHVITIDAGDTVVWTLNSGEIHSVVFIGTCSDISCIPPCALTVSFDISPCGSTTYDGVSIASSGRMVPAGYNWDNAFTNGGTTYALTFTNPGVNVYFDLSVSGMRGVVIVHPAGTPYPFTQAQYAQQARDQLQADLAAGARARDDFQPVTTSTNPNGTQLHHVALGTSPPESASVELGAVKGSDAHGSALLEGIGVGTSPTPAIAVKVALSGLQPGSVHAVQILLGVCGAPAPTTGLFFNAYFGHPTFTLSPVTAGPDGRGTSTTILTQPPNSNGPAQLRIPSAGWFINVAAGSTPDNGATSAACGNVVFHNAAVMRDLPQNVHVRVGDTVVWTNDTSNEVHGVTFLAGQALPLIPDWFFSAPSGNPASYDGSSFLNSGALYAADAIFSSGAPRTHSFAVTFTKTGSFSYVDVAYAFLGMRGSVIVTPTN